MKIRQDYKLPSPFMGNYYCLIPKTNLAFVVISKNACTFLKKVSIYNDEGIWIENFTDVHNKIGYNSSSKYLVPVSRINAYERKNGPLIKFAIWREPIERVISTYKLFCLEREYRKYFHFLAINEEVSFDRFMEFVHFEWGKSTPVMQDEHIRRQCDYYKQKNVDFIVPINKMHQFLQEHNVPFINEVSNNTKEKFEIENEAHLKAITEYYKLDYKIKINY